MGINIQGVIYTLKMTFDGNIVDLAKCAARYASFGSSTDDRHDTHHSFFLPCVCYYFQISSLTFFESSLSNSKTRK